MMCYKDMTFCTFWESCKKGNTCYRALTPEIVENAKLWWGAEGDAPIMMFDVRPRCWEDKEL